MASAFARPLLVLDVVTRRGDAILIQLHRNLRGRVLADVLTRVGDYPAAQIDDLLPHRWVARAAAA